MLSDQSRDAYIRVQQRLLVEGWDDDLELDEAIVSDPEYVRSLDSSGGGVPRITARQQARVDGLVDAWMAEVLGSES